jgi:peptide/nickel transport system substrate-binding protein
MLPEALKSPSLRVVEYPGFRYGYLAFNLRDSAGAAHPLFADRALRRALTMAVDRRTLVRSAFDTLAVPALGPFVRSMPTADTTIHEIPFDPAAAARMLDSLGWRTVAGSTTRMKNGKPLSFAMLTPASSKDRARLAVLIQNQLAQVGVDARVQTVDNGVFARSMTTHAFDAALIAWLPDPDPATVLAVWGSASAAQKGSPNVARYASATFDREIDSASHARTLAAARPLYAAAYQTIVDDAPAIWLYESRNVVGAHRRIHLGTLRADAWWSHLADWYVPPREQIARDRVPVAADTTRGGAR